MTCDHAVLPSLPEREGEALSVAAAATIWRP